MEQQAAHAPEPQPPPPAPNRRRRTLIVSITATFLVGVLAWGLYWATVLRYEEGTDNAYVNGNVVQITSQVAGTVVRIDADDTDFVKAGTPLVRLDTADAKVALEEAESQLAKTVRQVRNLYVTSGSLDAVVRQRQVEFAKTQDDMKRRERLAQSGAVSGEELQHAKDALSGAEAALLGARQQLAAHRTLVDHTTVDDHPDVQAAAAKVHEAFIAYSRTTLPAPVSGFVAKRNVQLGQRIAPGAPLMAVVALDDVWVDANFKEAQLRNMRAGQPVTLTADLYGSRFKYHGRVMGFGAGTGGAFALLPAQNASGNWIKIVQRVPVRIALDAGELKAHPLQVGLSMQAEVDTHDRDGERLPQVARNRPADVSAVYANLDQMADARVHTIIAANATPSRANAVQ